LDDKRLAFALFDDPSRAFAVELWDGTVLYARGGPATRDRLVLRKPSALRDLLPPAIELRLAEAFIDDGIDVTGQTARVLEQIASWNGPRAPFSALPRVAAARLERRLRRRTHALRDGRDPTDELCRLLLDASMTCSCAYFANGGEPLDEAQRAQLELVCKKLDLSPGEQLLDLGCGWGSLLVYASERHDARAVGVTESPNQFFEARRRAARLSLPGRVRIVDCDVRRLPPDTFDKASSIGMMGYADKEHLDRILADVFARLRPGGLFLSQNVTALASDVRLLPFLSRVRGGFVETHISRVFELPLLGDIVCAAERQGFEVRDVECLREHYAATLVRWLHNLESRFDQAARVVGRRRARAWRLYLAGCAAAFRLGRVGCYQVLLAKRDERGRARGVPKCPKVWYEEAHADSVGVLRSTPTFVDGASGRVSAVV
jgi:cyclopropane-fatty-acyl-phospholipid synthase